MDIKQIKTLNLNKKNILFLTGSVLFCELAGIISKITINSDSLIWYKYLFKPALNPPSWFFQGVWTILYLSMGIALYLVLNKENLINKKAALIIFGTQLLLSALWAPVFFGLTSIAGGFVVTILLWLSLYATLYKFYKISKHSVFFLIPSLLWVSYMIGLNLSFLFLNS